MVLAYLGDERGEAQLAQAMDAYWYGVPASRITRLTSWGYHVTYEQTTLAQLCDCLAVDSPASYSCVQAHCPDGARMCLMQLS